MKRNFNKILLGAILLFSACSTEELVFPNKLQGEVETGVIDVIVKPSDVKVVGDYDRTFVITWPKFSDKIEKVVLTYDDAGTTHTKEVVDFLSNLEIITTNVEEYEFKFVSVAKDGRQTDPVFVKAENKGLYIAELLERSSLNTEGKYVSISVPNPLKSLLKVTIDYSSSSGIVNEVIESSEENIEFTFNGTGGPSFTITIEDEKSNKVTEVTPYTLVPISYTTANQKMFWTPWAPNGYAAGFSAERAIDGTIGTGYEFVSGSNANPFIYKISFTKARVTGDPNYSSAALQNPSGEHSLITVQSVTIHSGAVAWGINPNMARVYGILEDDTSVSLGTFSSPTAVNVGNPFVIDLSSNTQAFKAIRFEFINSLTSPTNTGVNINEINLAGFPED